MDLDDAAEELYAGSPDEFVERRTALVAQARAARDRALAKQIAALRRPTRTAWLINRLARDDAAGITALLELVAGLEDAQRRRSGSDLRRLSAERRTLVDRLARDAVRRGREAGYEAADGALQEVSQSLQSALGDPATADLLRRGRLTTAVSYGGFGSSDLMAAMAASMPAAAGPPSPTLPRPEPALGAEPEPEAAEPEPEPEPEPLSEPEPMPAAEPEPEPVDEARREQQRRAEEAEAAWEQAAATLTAAEQEAEEATARADALADRVEELQAELARAEAEETDARTEARAARRRHQAAARAAEEAEQARDAARAALGT